VAKRGNNEGTISLRKDGRWEARLTIPGGRRIAYYGTTRADVSAKLKLAAADLERGLLAVGPKQTVSQFLTSWLNDVAKPTVRERTLIRYESLIRLHIAPAIGTVTLSKLTPQHIIAMHKAIGVSVAPRTVGHAHRVLHCALETAVRWNYIVRNPADLVSPPKVTKPETAFLTTEQARKLLETARAIQHPDEALYVTLLATGLRLGEALALRWSDVELAAASLAVKRSVCRLPGQGFVFQPPKTKRSERTVSLAPFAVDALRRHRARQNAERLKAGDLWEDGDLVFANAFGRPREMQNVSRRSFRPLLAAAGLPVVRIHDLRHSAASLLLPLGVHIKIVSEILGHSTTAITLDTYSHSVPSLQADATRRLGDLLSGATSV
jgi:integrase